MNTDQVIRTTWNPTYIPLNAEGRPVFGSDDFKIHNEAAPRGDRKLGPIVNPDSFVDPKTQELCYSVRYAAEVLGMLQPSVQNRIQRGCMIWYTSPNPRKPDGRQMNALPAWQFDESVKDVLEKVYHAYPWSKNKTMTDFVRTHSRLLRCTPQEAILAGRGREVIAIVESMSL